MKHDVLLKNDYMHDQGISIFYKLAVRPNSKMIIV
jgi:hypothetical protein